MPRKCCQGAGWTWLPPRETKKALKKFSKKVATGPYWRYERVWEKENRDGSPKYYWIWLTFREARQ